MANPGYVRSTDGSNADNGSTWALANADLTSAMADHSAGDRIWVSDNHAETVGGTIVVPGTLASPCQILCGDDSAEPPTALATTGSITTTGTTAITWQGSFYCYGLIMQVGTINAVNLSCGNTGHRQKFKSCQFKHAASATGAILAGVVSGTAASLSVEWEDCDVRFGAAGSNIKIGSQFHWNGGSLLSGGTSPTTLFLGSDRGGIALIENIDLSNASASINLVAGSDNEGSTYIFRNIKMPASWSGSVVSGTIGAGNRIIAYNVAAAVASGTNNFSLWVQDYGGHTRHETTIVRTGGASDGDTPISYKVTTAANAEYPWTPHRSIELKVPITSTGSKTLTIHCVSDENVAAGQGAGTGNMFQDNEIAMEVRFLGTTDSPQGSFSTSLPSVVTTPSDLSSSSETWTTTGMTTPQKFQLSRTFTVNEECVALVTIVGYKASKEFYYCPKVEVS